MVRVLTQPHQLAIMFRDSGVLHTRLRPQPPRSAVSFSVLSTCTANIFRTWQVSERLCLYTVVVMFTVLV